MDVSGVCWCPGAQSHIDIAELPESELAYSPFWDTYCPTKYCKASIDCKLCEQSQFSKPITIDQKWQKVNR